MRVDDQGAGGVDRLKRHEQENMVEILHRVPKHGERKPHPGSEVVFRRRAGDLRRRHSMFVEQDVLEFLHFRKAADPDRPVGAKRARKPIDTPQLTGLTEEPLLLRPKTSRLLRKLPRLM